MTQRTKAFLAATVALGVLSACASTSNARGSAGETASSIGSSVKSGASSVRTSVGNRASAVGGWFAARRPGAGSRSASLDEPSGAYHASYDELEQRLAAAEQRVAALTEQLAANASGSDYSIAPLAAPTATPFETDSGMELLGAPGGDVVASVAAPAGVGGGSPSFGVASDYPPDAAPGQCFARVLTPPVTRIVRQEEPVSPQRTEIRVIPAVFEAYEEEVIVEPARVELVSIPAEYREETKQVLVKAAYVTWKRGEGLFGSEEPDETRVLPTGEVMCRVTVPAEYKTVTERILVSPARTEERDIPARVETVTHRREVEPQRIEEIVHPASSQWVERAEVVEEGRLEWREVLCRTNATRGKIAEVQQALAAQGYAPGPADGVFGPRTLDAMESFQRTSGIAVGQLTRETVEALGLVFETRDI